MKLGYVFFCHILILFFANVRISLYVASATMLLYCSIGMVQIVIVFSPFCYPFLTLRYF